MEVQVAVPVPVPVPGDFNFDSNCSSPYITAPSSPQRFGNLFFSAPTSPTRISPLFDQSSVPLHWEQTSENNNNDDFAFDFSGNLETTSLSAADELFHAGKIRPLRPPSPPRLQPNDGAISPRKRISPEIEEEKRGRERVLSSGRKGSRSLSPLRVSDIAFESEDNKDVSSSSSNTKSFLSFTKKWRLRNFLLFRSASEGRATENDPLRKYTALSKKEDDVRNCSFRSSDSGSVSKRRGPVSAHELHYTLNRAASEEMRKKTFLPYKQGLLGCLGFNRDMRQISKGIGSLPRS